MLDTILDDNIQIVSASNEMLFDEKINFKDIKENYDDAIRRFGQEKQNKLTTLTQSRWLIENNIQDPKDKALSAARNFSLLEAEAQARSENGSKLKPIAVDSSDLERSVYELSETIENSSLIRDMYRLRKQTTSLDGGISITEAAKIKHCFSQGRELYRSGNSGSLLVKPLNYFYAITAYAYGVVVLNNPIRFRKDMIPASHGINYLPNELQVQFGGDMPRGTFSDLHNSFPVTFIKNKDSEIPLQQIPSILEFYKSRVTCSLGTLLSLVPEMGDFYSISTGRASRVYPLVITPSRQIKDPSPTFIIGDGVRRPSEATIRRAFPDMPMQEVRGTIEIKVSPEELSRINATIYSDVNTRLWFIDTPFGGINMPEISLHFLILCMFSNIMRYRPDEWGGLVDNDVSANVSLATRHYFNVLERKFNVLMLRESSEYFPYAPM